LLQIIAYTVVMFPIFTLQDLIEWARVLSTKGRHKFRTSEHRYFEKQRLHYNVLRARKGIQVAEDFLMKTSVSMHINENFRLTLNDWLKGGYRRTVIGALESKYGPLVPGESAATNSVTQPRKAPTMRNRPKSEVDSIVVKPVKGLR